MVEKISIIGAGWLGLPLARQLLSLGNEVIVSTRSQEKCEMLHSLGLNAFAYRIDDFPPPPTELLNPETILLTVPPSGISRVTYQQALERFFSFIPDAEKKTILFLSSVSVYGDPCTEVNELTEPDPQTESAIQLAEAEDWIQAGPFKNYYILRLAGLIGPGRHPGRFLSGRKNVPNGEGPANLLHLDDAISAILHLIKTKPDSAIFNLCCNETPERMHFYPEASKQLGLEPPEFIREKNSWKKINNQKFKQVTGFNYYFSSPLDTLKL